MRGRAKRRRAWFIFWSVSAVVLSIGAGADQIQIGTATIPVTPAREAVITLVSKVLPKDWDEQRTMVASAVSYSEDSRLFMRVPNELATVHKKPGMRAPIEKTEFSPDGAPHMLCIYVREQGYAGTMSCFPRSVPKPPATEPPPMAIARAD